MQKAWWVDDACGCFLAGDATECRIMVDVPSPACDLGNLVCVELTYLTTAYLWPTLLKVAPVTGDEGTSIKRFQSK